MSIFLLVLAAATLLISLYFATQVISGFVRMTSLKDEPPAYGSLPKVSLIVAARNEERHIEAALCSLLRIDYEPLEITVVNDRSNDGTGAILRRLAQQNPHINLVEITDLPSDWLGKNHALHDGAARSHGDWLLFTDADIVFEPLAIRRAIGYVLKNKVDHLCLAPDTRMPTWMLRSIIVAFSLMFHIFIRSWKVSDPKSKAHVGIGAFNLVRREVYLAIGGHQLIAMRPDDDVKLGKIIKDGGYRSRILNGVGEIRVEWYDSLWELIIGLEKNSFAVMDYNPFKSVVASAALLLITVWPFVALLFASGPTWWLNLITAGIWWGLAALAAAILGAPLSMAIMFPVANVLFCFITLRSMWITLRTGGIRWRDTFYPLAKLKANRV